MFIKTKENMGIYVNVLFQMETDAVGPFSVVLCAGMSSSINLFTTVNINGESLNLQ